MNRKLSAALLCGILCLTLPMADAEAKRLGGSRSFGMQRNTPAQTAPQPSSPSRPETAPAAAPTPAPTPATPPKAPQKRSWLGPLAGLAAGLGLGALLSHFGLGEGFGTLLLVALLAFGAILLFRILAGRSRPEPGLAYPTAPPASAPPPPLPASPPLAQAASDADWRQGVDEAAFLRQAKLNFIRLQAAFDKGDLADLREFTSPEVYAEVRQQLSERGNEAQQTDVVDLSATLLELAREDGRYIASVRFFGLIREDAHAGPVPFREIWHLTKPEQSASGWVVAGIQQET